MEKKTILICPLDWGLGHAARCVPIINELLRLGFDVLIGADKNPLTFLQKEFPQLKTIVIPGYEVTYDKKGSFLKLFAESVRFNYFIKREHRMIDQIIIKNNIDVVISDNRYGLWSKNVKSILITHQLYPKMRIGSSILHNKIKRLISNFNECWIPDMKGEFNLSGDLSHLEPFKYPHKFIGPLSRFSFLFPEKEQRENNKYDFDIIAILSGPEPQRTIFEKLILEQLKNTKLKAIVVRGLPYCTLDEPEENNNISIYNHLSTAKFSEYFQKSKTVVCRAGYSSIMDLMALNKQAILVPTPGQTEQEYLAKYHLRLGNFYSQKQSKFDLQKGLVEAENYFPKMIAKDKLTIELL